MARDLSAHRRFGQRYLAKVVTLYILFSVFWIFVSDGLVARFITDHETTLWVSIAKGWLFILVTTSLLYLLISRFFRAIASRDREILALNAGLERRVAERTAALGAEIAERRRVEERLRYSEERLRLTLDGAQLGIWHHRLDPEHLDWSDICKRHLALRPGEQPSFAGFIAALHPDDRARVMRLVETSLATGQDYAAEYRVLWPDGTAHWISALGRVYCRADGTPERLGGITLDITRRKRLEEELQGLNATLEQRIAARTAELVTAQTHLHQALADMAQSESKFRTIFEQSPLGIALLDGRTDQLLTVNQSLERFLGRSAAEIADLGWAALTHPEDLATELAQVTRLKAGEIAGFQVEKRYLRPDGTLVWGHLIVATVDMKDERRQIHLALVKDITARMLADQQMRESEARYRMLFNHTADAILILDLEGRVIDVNDQACRQYGYARDELLRLHITDIDTPEDAVNAPGRIAQLDSQGQASFEAQHRDAQGRVIPVEIRATKVLLDGRPAMFNLCRDISAQKKAQERIEYLAFHDELTGLPNRVLGQYQLLQAISVAQRHQARLAVLYLDLDRFKYVNDTHGHAAGDRLLKGLARRLGQLLRAEDALCRLSADEFMLVLPELAMEQAVMPIAETCERLLASLAVPFDLQGRPIHASLSIGVAIYPQDGRDGETLMRNADTALNEAKRAGRQTYRFFEARMNDELTRFIHTRDALRDALDREEFVLHYQPQLDLRTGQVVGVEALLRWQRPGVGLVTPHVFIDVAEESGLIAPLGRWVLGEACRQAAQWRASGWPELVMAVNLSAVQFRDRNLGQEVMAILAESGLDPVGLELELTESLLLQSEGSVLATLLEWKAQGIQLSIDDFGTGYSSLAYLKRFKVDKLKIDRSFLVNLLAAGEDRAIVQAMIQIARSLNLKTLAEGVEEAAQADQLRVMGCDQVQGYLYAKPLPASELTGWLAAQTDPRQGPRSGPGHQVQSHQDSLGV